MRTVSWTKLTEAEVRDSLWGQTVTSNLGGMEAVLRESFTIEEKAKKLGEKTDKPAEKKKRQVLDPNKQQAVGIVMGFLKLDLGKAVEAVVEMDDDMLSGDAVARLQGVIPPPEDTKELVKLTEAEALEYPPPERLLWALLRIPRVRVRLTCWGFRERYPAAQEEVRTGLKTIDAACNALKKNAKLKEVLMTILAMGNTLNRESFVGAAAGIRLNNLADTLRSVRSVKGDSTLFDLLVRHLLEVSPGVCDFTKDLTPLIDAASSVAVDTLIQTLRELLSGVKSVSAELDRSRKAAEGGDEEAKRAGECFSLSFGSFFERAKVEVVTLEAEVERAHGLLQETGRWFGEKQDDFNEVVFFRNLLSFFKGFDKLVSEARDRERRLKKATKTAPPPLPPEIVVVVAAAAAAGGARSRRVRRMEMAIQARMIEEDDSSSDGWSPPRQQPTCVVAGSKRNLRTPDRKDPPRRASVEREEKARRTPRQNLEPAVESVVWSARTAAFYPNDVERERAHEAERKREAEVLAREILRLQRERETAGDELTSESSLDTLEKEEEERLERDEKKKTDNRCSDWLRSVA
eukprot:Hpha_TRINITY_DN16550_c0_g5::TRINITY_DN16550_c0_g5_i1::g.132629::m.132629